MNSHPLVRVLLALFLCLAPVAPLTSCSTVDTVSVPEPILELVRDRTAALSQLRVEYPSLSNDAFADEIDIDSASWSAIEDAQGFFTPVALKQAAQSQKIATEIAALKIRAGEYADPQKLDLIDGLQSSWSGLSRYYEPEESE